MNDEYCAYPPRLGDDVEITEDRDGDRLTYVVGSTAVGRYLLLRAAEYKVLGLLSGALAPGEVCEEFQRRYGATLPLPTLQKFLAKLDGVGILAGQRARRSEAWDQQSGGSPYFRINLFNPDRLFDRVVSRLRWIWTKEFLVFTLALMFVALGLALMNRVELLSYSGQAVREHFVAILIAGLLVGLSHEFAHGLTSKAFGGRATEVGLLMIYSCLPALYCNVSGLHLIRQRHQRLWVIAAGIYWQLLVGTVALLLWFVFDPHTLLANVALIFFLGSVLDVFINANPLIKLDGYYFLSQWLRMPNLMDRSRAYWRGLWRRVVSGERDEAAAQPTRCVVYAVFGLLSWLYIVALLGAIVLFVGGYLADSFYLPGLVLTGALALWFLRRPLKQVLSTGVAVSAKWVRRIRKDSLNRSVEPCSTRAEQTGPGRAMVGVPVGGSPAENDRNDERDTMGDEPGKFRRLLPSFLTRRRLVVATPLLLISGTLLMPWTASVGNYGTLGVIPGQEAIIRAPESATLVALFVGPGDVLAGAAVIGRMGSPELEDLTAEVRSDLARARTEHQRLQGELSAHRKLAARAEVQWRQKQYDYNELTAEQEQIKTQRPTKSREVSTNYPAAISVLEADVSLRQARFAEADSQLERARQLSTLAILPTHELEIAETRCATLAIELNAARHRLEAALIEHRRKHTSASTDMLLARADLMAEQAHIEQLEGESGAMRTLIETLEKRLDLLDRRQAQLELATPRAGTVFGEELPRRVGQFFPKGAEICRVAETHQLLARIQVPEAEIGDVRIGDPVRLKARAFPDQLFRGVVSKIGGESEPDEHRRKTYRVELTIEHHAGLLRPGMTAFARIDFDRQMIGRILLHKLKQALRPELWML
jgi:multidrug efflux pump subunit AcrA (membrane-fusion protein)